MLEKLLVNLKTKAGFVNESTISFVLGIIVVAVSAFIAYSYFHQSAKNPSPVQTTNKESKVEPKTTATVSGQLTPATSTVAKIIDYTVSEGDTLWTISEKVYGSGFEWRRIAEINPKVNPSDLIIGSKIQILNPTETIAQAPATSISGVTLTSNKITGDSYIVAHNDTLWDIALRAYGDPYRWIDIAKANNLSDPWIIHSENNLTIPR